MTNKTSIKYDKLDQEYSPDKCFDNLTAVINEFGRVNSVGVKNILLSFDIREEKVMLDTIRVETTHTYLYFTMQYKNNYFRNSEFDPEVKWYRTEDWKVDITGNETRYFAFELDQVQKTYYLNKDGEEFGC